MNKFKQLQLAGTLIVLTPVLLVAGAVGIYNLPESQEVEVVEEVVLKAPKADTVIVVKEVEKVAPPVPAVKKPVPPPPPPPLVVKDTVQKVAEKLDTIK
jgi:hypothetical protein